MPILSFWGCDVYVATRNLTHQQDAAVLGAKWAGDTFDRPPEALDAAITFAPIGKVVIAALKALDKGGIIAINAIHLDEVPAFDYDLLLWQERQMRSVANMTRQDAIDFLAVADQVKLRPRFKTFPLREANDALKQVRDEGIQGSAVIVPWQ
jgi:propanol-preferring alcohol dehydrogenase